ncbi:hypothetical protein DSECCO2_315100 [anaerobic digester metagenome]
MQQFHGIVGISEVQFKAAGALYIENPCFVALHNKSKDGSPRNGANAISVAIEVALYGEVGIKDTGNGAKGRSGFIFRSVDNHFGSFVGARAQLIIIHALGA